MSSQVDGVSTVDVWRLVRALNGAQEGSGGTGQMTLYPSDPPDPPDPPELPWFSSPRKIQSRAINSSLRPSTPSPSANETGKRISRTGDG